jgi:hypothetical protein
MIKYIYTGTNQIAFTLGDNSEYILQPNDVIELPSENNYIKLLVAMNLLKEIKETQIKLK